MNRVHLSLPATFGIVLVALVLAYFPIVDPDFFWHIKIGEMIRESGRIPSVEVLSHTAAGQPWVIQGWLADVVLESVWRTAGVPGTRALVALLLLLTWWCSYRAALLYVAREETALLVSAMGVALITPALAPRPTLMTALCLSVVVLSLLKYRRTGQMRWLTVLPAVFALWANLHFGFVTGLGVWGLLVAGDLLERIRPFRLGFTEKGSLASRGPLALMALTVVAIGLNPLGLGIYDTIFFKFLDDASSPIAEWQTASFSSPQGKVVYLGICVFIVARALGRHSIHWVDIVVPLAAIGAGLAAQRHIPLMGILLVPFTARALANVESPVFSTISRGPLAFLGERATRDLGSGVSTAINLLAIICVIAVAVATMPMVARHFDVEKEKLQPEGVVDFILDNGLTGRIFNTYNSGGFLSFRLYPTQRVFIDGRFNPYPKEVVDDYFAIVRGEPGWFEKLNRYGIDIVVCERSSAFRQLMMLRNEFRLVYDQGEFSILVRDLPRFADLRSIESPR